MKAVIPVLCVLFLALMIVLPAAADDRQPAFNTSLRATVHEQSPVREVPAQPAVSRVPYGEVMVPVMPRIVSRAEERTPTVRTPTPLSTTPRPPTTAPGTTVPVVTRTVFVTVQIPSNPVYVPYYPNYYPPYYPYPYTYGYTGILTVRSSPSQAMIIVDGYNTGTTPYIFTGMATGYHTVEVDYPGYQAYVTSVYLENGQSMEINADLTPLVSSGSLYIDSTPPGADVYVNGNYEGTTPLTVGSLVAGPHQVELHLAGYEVLTSTQSIAPGQGTVARFSLVPYGAGSGSGSVDITATPAGALVYLDGIYKGSVQSPSGFHIVAVSPGPHDVLLHLPGYADFNQTVTVYAGKVAGVNAVFTPLPAGPQGSSAGGTGSIVVTSAPSGGQVTLDNTFRGVTPVTIYNVDSGTHIVNMHLDGYSDWSGSVNVVANQVAQVPATLTPDAGASPASTRAAPGPAAILAVVSLAAALVWYRSIRT